MPSHTPFHVKFNLLQKWGITVIDDVFESLDSKFLSNEDMESKYYVFLS